VRQLSSVSPSRAGAAEGRVGNAPATGQRRPVGKIIERFLARSCAIDLPGYETAGVPIASAAFFDYSPSRHGEYPRRILANCSDVMQADAFAGFNELYAEGRRPGPIFAAGALLRPGEAR
jgi:hypothetical protein